MRPVPRRKPSSSDPLILLVDDVADNIEVYAQFFLHRGWRTATASDGQESLTSAAGLRPDVIVLDLGMPGMDGWEVARRLKADAITRSIPILALTGHVLGDSRRRALEAGVEEFLTKPCLPQDLAEAIKRHLPPR
jgi:two-component system, cell cycle response regulator DivK